MEFSPLSAPSDDRTFENDLISILKVEYTRTFQCSECGFEESAVPSIPTIEGEFIPLFYGSGVDYCTNCSKPREEHEETTDSPADYYESEGELNDHNVQAEAKDQQTMCPRGLQ